LSGQVSALLVPGAGGASGKNQVKEQIKGQAKGQATQLLSGQINALLAPGAGGASGKNQIKDQIKGQAKGQATQLLSGQINALLAPGAGGASGKNQGMGSQIGSQVSQALGATMFQTLAGGGGTNPTVGLRNGLERTATNTLTTTATNALTAAATQHVGANMSGVSALVASRMEQGLQQGLSSEVEKRVGLAGAQPMPGLRDSMKGAAAGALAGSVQYSLTNALSPEQQPLAGDLLTLGLNMQKSVDLSRLGGFAPPSDLSSFGAAHLHNGVNILSNSSGQVGLGVQSDLKVGSKKVKIGGTLDPNLNSNSAQGATAGVQVTVGGN
jgi:hypothetical protein